SVEEPGQMRLGLKGAHVSIAAQPAVVVHVAAQLLFRHPLRAHAARGCDMPVQAYSEAADSRNKRGAHGPLTGRALLRRGCNTWLVVIMGPGSCWRGRRADTLPLPGQREDLRQAGRVGDHRPAAPRRAGRYRFDAGSARFTAACTDLG